MHFPLFLESLQMPLRMKIPRNMSWMALRIAALSVLILLIIACTTGRKHLASDVGDALLDAPLTAGQMIQFEPEALRFDSLLKTELEARGGIVFSGSSSIRKWETLNSDMAPLPVVNRGFGGAIIKQVTHYTGKMIVPLYPKLVVFYCGENDIANDKYPAEMPLNDFKAFTKHLRSRLPNTGILFISLKPSPLRWKWWPKFQETNRLIAEYISKEKKMWYVDVSQPMLGRNGKPIPELFTSDSLHMNSNGYALWTKILKPEVAKRFDEVK